MIKQGDKVKIKLNGKLVNATVHGKQAGAIIYSKTYKNTKCTHYFYVKEERMVLHREDGPATLFNDDKDTVEWYYHGKSVGRGEYGEMAMLELTCPLNHFELEEELIIRDRYISELEKQIEKLTGKVKRMSDSFYEERERRSYNRSPETAETRRYKEYVRRTDLGYVERKELERERARRRDRDANAFK